MYCRQASRCSAREAGRRWAKAEDRNQQCGQGDLHASLVVDYDRGKDCFVAEE